MVVEKITKGFGAEQSHLRPGDVLLTWSRGPEQGKFNSPFDFIWVETEQRPRGEVELRGYRLGKPRTWRMGLTEWRTRTRPNFPDGVLVSYRKLIKSLSALPSAQEMDSFIPEETPGEVAAWLKPWLSSRFGLALQEAGQCKQSEQAYSDALQNSTTDISIFILTERIKSRSRWCITWPSREKYLNQILALSQQENLQKAWALDWLGLAASNRGDVDAADDLYKRALLIQGRLAPNGIGVAFSFACMGFNNVNRDDLGSAERYFRQALAIQERLTPLSLDTSGTLDWLAIVAQRRYDPATAEKYFRKALSIEKRRDPQGRGVFNELLSLVHTEEARGDLKRAELLAHQCLVLARLPSADQDEVAHSLKALGTIAFARHRFAQGERYLNASIKAFQKAGPNLPAIEDAFFALGMAAQNAKKYDRSEIYFRRAIDTGEKISPGSLLVAEYELELANILVIRGKMIEAEGFYRRSLARIEKLSPSAPRHTSVLAGLAGVLAADGHLEDAAQLYDRALAMLDGQVDRFSSNKDSRTEFRSAYTQIYEKYAGLLVLLRQPEKAFDVLERSRSRTMLETLANIDFDQHGNADAGLLAQERGLQMQIGTINDERIRALSADHTAERVLSLEREISDLTAQYQEIEAQISAANSVHPVFMRPQPLSLAEVQHSLLDHDTVLLEYVLGEERSYVFVAEPDSIHAVALSSRSEIERAARNLHSLLRTYRPTEIANTTRRAEKRPEALESAIEALSRTLLDPVAESIAGKRIVIVASGALQYIPFAALFDPGSQARGTEAREPLILNHDVVNLPSASVLGVIRQQQAHRSPAPKAVAVFADPVFDNHDARLAALMKSPSWRGEPLIERSRLSDKEDYSRLLTRSARDVGLTRSGELSLPRLRYSRREAEAIRAEAGSAKTKDNLDFRATRKNAMSSDLRQYRIVHFATHGILNSAHPELSGLVLSMVDENGNPQNGFLQLQDIYNLNLPADLVVLSACETALGKEIKGEGMIGLTRGFMYAGASRVVASLWKVSDVATATLMADFYRAMEKDGMPASAALRAAQINMWKQKRWSDPYFWAAFQIQGEWR